jgi:hyperosmotically inducible protein
MNRKAIPGVLVAAVAAVGLGGCAAWNDSHMRTSSTSATTTATPRGPAQTAHDATITAKVKTALAADEMVKARRIDVDTLRGVVQLNGTVSSAAEKDRAMTLARQVEGVVEVRDNLKTSG